VARRAASFAIALWAFALLAVLPAAAGAATVANGDFESGTLAGWQVRRATTAGDWFAYKGTDAPIGHRRGAAPVQPPPQGSFAAIADQANPESLVLFQDLALEPGSSYRLGLVAFYDSYAPLAAPDTLSVDEEALGAQANQQFRIDLLRPGAPLDSVNPADVLQTLFRTKAGAPARMKPTLLEADLAPFAGQTVRLRVAVAATEEVLNAGVDAVSLSPRGGDGPVPPGERVRVGKAKANRKNGTLRLSVRVPGAGRLTVGGNRKLKRASRNLAQAGQVVLRLRPSAKGRAILKRQHRLRVKATLTWSSVTGVRETVRLPLLFKLKKR